MNQNRIMALLKSPRSYVGSTYFFSHFLALIYYSNSQIKSRHYTFSIGIMVLFGFICVLLSYIHRPY